MTEIIIVSQNKKYCGFVSKRMHKMKNYKSYQDSDQYYDTSKVLEEKGTYREISECDLLSSPSKRAMPFNLNKDSTSITISFVSFPRVPDEQYTVFPTQRKHNEYNVKDFEVVGPYPYNHYHLAKPVNLEDLLVRFEIKAYEYGKYEPGTCVIDERDPKLEEMLGTILRNEQERN